MLAMIERAQEPLRRAQGFRFSFVETSVGDVRVLRMRGTGALPPVVVIHGFAATAFDMEPVIRRLRPYVREIIAPDLPGHGGSDAPKGGMNGEAIQRGVIEALDLVLGEPAVVLGSSLGGGVALKVALARPDLTLGLYLCSPGGAAMPIDQIEEIQARFSPKTHRDALKLIETLFVGRYPVIRHALGWGLRQRLSRPATRDLLRSLGPDDLLTADSLAELNIPITIMWGEAERLLPDSCLQFFQDALPNQTKFYQPEGVGHAPNMEAPSMLAECVVEFAEEIVGELRSLPALGSTG